MENHEIRAAKRRRRWQVFRLANNIGQQTPNHDNTEAQTRPEEHEVHSEKTPNDDNIEAQTRQEEHEVHGGEETLNDDNTEAQTRQEEHEFHGEEEEQKARNQYEDFQFSDEWTEQSKLPNLAAHFAILTNAVQKGISDEKTIDITYDNFIHEAKKKLVSDLKETYSSIYNFYRNPSSLMPKCLTKSPPEEGFCLVRMDSRLASRLPQIMQDLKSFLEEHGFVSPNVKASDVKDVSYALGYRVFVYLRLDVARVPTQKARKDVNERLQKLRLTAL